MDFKFNALRLFLSLTFFTSMLGCANPEAFDLNSPNLPCTVDCNENDSLEEIPPIEEIDPELLAYKGLINGGPADQSTAIELDMDKKALLLSIPLAIPYLSVNPSQGKFKELPQVEFISRTNDLGKAEVLISIPLKYVLKGVKHLPPSKLPNGDPLPFIVSGELPKVALSLPNNENFQIHLYIGVGMVGAFISTPIDPYVALTFHIRNPEQTKVVGSFSLVPEKNSFLGGFFVTAVLPDQIAAKLEDILQ